MTRIRLAHSLSSLVDLSVVFIPRASKTAYFKLGLDMEIKASLFTIEYWNLT